jgi:serine/threonine protein kinase
VVPTDPVQIVTELCRGGAVFELLHNKQELEISWRQKLKMCSDTAAGLEYLHGLTPPVLHRDLKSLNLLIVEPFEGRESVDISLKVCDFGLSRLKDEGLMTHGVGTSNWIAPELIGVGAGAYTEKVDTYSYGMIMFEVICREVPYEDILNAGQVIQHVKTGGRPDEEAIPPDCSPSWVELMKECWAEDPSRRPPFTRIRERLAEFERAL